MAGNRGADGARGRVAFPRRSREGGIRVTAVGRGEPFRTASWFERATARFRGERQRAAPRLLRRAHEFVLDRLPGDHLVSTLPGGERIRALRAVGYLYARGDS